MNFSSSHVKKSLLLISHQDMTIGPSCSCAAEQVLWYQWYSACDYGTSVSLLVVHDLIQGIVNLSSPCFSFNIY